MRKIQFQIPFVLLNGILCLAITGCIEKVENKLSQNIEADYEFERSMITYDLGDGVTEEVELYIDKMNDTIGNQVFAYKEKILDSSRSLFYDLKLNRVENSNEYDGIITYYFNSNREGNLIDFNFVIISKTDEKTVFLDFTSAENENQIKFKYFSIDDTIIGHIHARHAMDTIVDGEDRIRFREIFISVDNYSKTNNPFTKGLR